MKESEYLELLQPCAKIRKKGANRHGFHQWHLSYQDLKAWKFRAMKARRAPSRPSRAFWATIFLLVIASTTRAFNLEPRIAILKEGLPGTYFGFSVAQHQIVTRDRCGHFIRIILSFPWSCSLIWSQENQENWPRNPRRIVTLESQPLKKRLLNGRDWVSAGIGKENSVLSYKEFFKIIPNLVGLCCASSVSLGSLAYDSFSWENIE